MDAPIWRATATRLYLPWPPESLPWRVTSRTYYFPEAVPSPCLASSCFLPWSFSCQLVQFNSAALPPANFPSILPSLSSPFLNNSLLLRRFPHLEVDHFVPRRPSSPVHDRCPCYCLAWLLSGFVTCCIYCPAAWAAVSIVVICLPSTAPTPVPGPAPTTRCTPAFP
jgi:hypothetical protein